MAKEQPGYYAIIPADVRYDSNLIQGAKLLYGEITALTNQKGYCWANDTYFTNLYKVSKKTIQSWLKSLETNGYITREVVYKEGSNEIAHRYIRLCAYPMHEKVHTPMHEKVRDNNTSFNNTLNNTNNIKHMCEKSSHDNDSFKNNFEIIWKEYPPKRRRDKNKCFAKYKKAIKAGTTHEQILNGLLNYKKEIELKKTKNEFIRLSSTWFNNNNWNDEYETSVGGMSDDGGRYSNLF